MSPLREVRYATPQEAQILDSRSRKGPITTKPRSAPMRDLADDLAPSLIIDNILTLVYEDHSDFPGSAFREAERVSSTLRIYLNQLGLSVSATLEPDASAGHTKLIICKRDIALE